MYIFQYIPNWVTKYVLSSNSTFCLKSLSYYRELEDSDNNDISDSWENKAEFHKQMEEYFNNAATLISCQSISSSNNNPEPNWNIFKKLFKSEERLNGIAILSEVCSVKEYLIKHRTGIFDEDRWNFRHNIIYYYNEQNDKPKSYNLHDAMFWKRREKYSYQDEYRFAFERSGTTSGHLQTVIFCNNPMDGAPDYIHKLFPGPEMNPEEINSFVNSACELYPNGSVVDKVDNWESWLKLARKNCD